MTDRTYHKLQNRFRGLISALQSRKFVKGGTLSSTSNFRSGLRNLLLDSRAELLVYQYDSFLSWIHFQMQTRIAKLADSPIGYDELVGIYTRAPIVSLQRELLWITARIKLESDKLNKFRSIAEEIEHLVFKNETDRAIETLQLLEQTFGTSLWGVQLRISLENLAGGLERQKKYTAEVRGVHKRGLLRFIAYHTSVRNEDRSTFAKYCDDIKNRIERHRFYDQPIKTYARYRLAGEWPTSEAGFAEILRVEQSHSIIDLYETFIAVAQEITRREDLVVTRELLAKCIVGITSTKDFRLLKALQLLNGRYDFTAFRCRNKQISNALFSGNTLLAVRFALRNLNSATEVDCWQYIYAGIAFSHSTRQRNKSFKHLGEISWLVGKVLNQSNCEDDSIFNLEKIATNFRGFPSIAGILDLIPLLRRPSPDEPWRPWLIGMNSPTIGVEDFLPNNELISLIISNGRSIDLTEEAWGKFQGYDCGVTGDSNTSTSLFSAAGLLREGRFEQAIEILSFYNKDGGLASLRSMAVKMLLHAYFSLGDRQSVISLIADEGSRGPVNMQLLPILHTLDQYVWDDYKSVSSPLAASIALHLLWSHNDSSTTASYIRFATSVAIRKSGKRLPSMLAESSHEYPPHQLIYFLKKVCVPEIIDHSRVLKSTREVLEERMAICRALRLLDAPNAGTHQDEVMAISYLLTLDEGQWVVHSTRVHVDGEMLLRWASKEFSEDYSRYQDLLSLDIGDKQNFDDVLKELTDLNSISKRDTFKLENESDTVMFDILARCRDEFLNNPNFGFDFYLSKRVRHQSFIGIVRGPVEFSNLITTRESESGQYHKNNYWLNKFITLNNTEKESLNNALVKFSTKFDDALITAKDKRFQLRSQEHPAGLFYIELSHEIMVLARAILCTDNTLPDFISTVIGILWGAIAPSLADARKFVSNELKSRISQEIDELRASVRKIAEHDPSFFEFDMEIGRRSTEVQRALDDVASWFAHSDIDASKRYFTLEQIVDISINSALRCRLPFAPEITREIDSDCEMLSSTSLVFVHDVLFTAIDNARAHSGHQNPKIVVKVIARKESGTLDVEVLCEAVQEMRAVKEEYLKEIRHIIETGNFGRRTRKEGKSGILKLAAVAQQSSKGNILFGFTDDEQFQLKVTHSLIVEEATRYGAACE